MNEKKLIEQFSLFGYEILKHGTHYSIFDRRTARRISEAESLEKLSTYAQKYLMFDFWSETLERTVAAFRNLLCPSPVTSPDPLLEESVTGEEKVFDPEPEQEQESSPVSPEPETAEPEPVQQQKDSPVLYAKTCKGCGKEFQTAHKQSMYCSPACYPSSKEKKSKTPESQEKACVIKRPI